MRKITFVVLSLFVLASLVLAACGSPAPTPTRAELEAMLTSMPTNTLEPTNTPAPTNTPLATFTATPTSVLDVGMQLRTAKDIRTLFSKVNGWVSCEEGLFTCGAQGSLAKDLILKDLPEGATFEFQCVQYHTVGGAIVIKKVCPDATVKFSEVIPAGSVGTMWLSWAVDLNGDKLSEGFLNKPCPCANGDCRKP